MLYVSGQTCKCFPSMLVLHSSVLLRKSSDNKYGVQSSSPQIFLNSVLNLRIAVRYQCDNANARNSGRLCCGCTARTET